MISADTVVVRDQTVLEKPASAQDAIDTLTSLSSRTLRVYTGVTLM